jgi:flagellar hook-associated protein 3 FlgL
MTSVLSSVQDLDIAKAAVELQSRLIALQAAQTTYIRIQGLSLFEFIR